MERTFALDLTEPALFPLASFAVVLHVSLEDPGLRTNLRESFKSL